MLIMPIYVMVFEPIKNWNTAAYKAREKNR